MSVAETHDPLVVFLYLLARDVAPTGVIRQLIGELQGPIFVLSDQHLASWAEEVAEDLCSREAALVEDGDEEDLKGKYSLGASPPVVLPSSRRRRGS